jgi:hypothetical protein
MPEISRFYRIVIKMYYNDHNPPHFYAEYGNEVAEYFIDTLGVLDGSLSKRAHALVLEWAFIHRNELMANWNNLRYQNSISKIEPLE